MIQRPTPAPSPPSPGHRTGRAAIERAGEATFDHALHGGSGRNTIQFDFAGGMTMPVAVQTWELEPGASEGAHVHDQEGRELEEFYLVLSGEAEMRLDGTTHALGAGDSVLCPPAAERGVSNPGPGPLRLLVVWGPPARRTSPGMPPTKRRWRRERAEALRRGGGPQGPSV